MPGTLSRRALPTIMNWAFALELLYFLVSPHQSNTNVWFHWFSWEESTDCKQSPLKTSTHMQLIPRTSDFFQAIENFPEFSFTEKVSNHGYPCVLLALWCPCIIGDSGVNIFNGNLKRIVLQGGGHQRSKFGQRTSFLICLETWTLIWLVQHMMGWQKSCFVQHVTCVGFPLIWTIVVISKNVTTFSKKKINKWIPFSAPERK